MNFLGLAPYLLYSDAAAALDWLTRVFGFDEEVRYLDLEGRVAEAELTVGACRILVGGHGATTNEGAGLLLIVQVDDVDAQHARVTAAGVTAQAPEDKADGPRTLEVTDPWGYRWTFWQHAGDDIALDEDWREVRTDAGEPA